MFLGVTDDYISEGEDIVASGDGRPVQRAAIGGGTDSQVAEYLGESAGQLRTGPIAPANAQRFIQHVLGALRAWAVSLLILALLALLAWRGGWIPDYVNGLRRGGMWMIGLAVALGLVAGVGIVLNPEVFWQFFTLFHQIFFTGDSWLFYYSDTLIRLFPIRFWEDAFLWAAILALGGGIGLAFGLRGKSPRRE
jgi:hypothetical protein